jgi:hypothetical protein
MSSFHKERQNHNTADLYMLCQLSISLDHILIFTIPKEIRGFLLQIILIFLKIFINCLDAFEEIIFVQ